MPMSLVNNNKNYDKDICCRLYPVLWQINNKRYDTSDICRVIYLRGCQGVSTKATLPPSTVVDFSYDDVIKAIESDSYPESQEQCFEPSNDQLDPQYSLSSEYIHCISYFTFRS